MTKSAPRKPTPIAVQRRQPTASRYSTTEIAVISSGAICSTAARLASCKMRERGDEARGGQPIASRAHGEQPVCRAEQLLPVSERQRNRPDQQRAHRCRARRSTSPTG